MAVEHIRFLLGKVLQLEWWPVTRDSVMYGISVIMLIKILEDERVDLNESIMLVAGYLFYLAVLYFNDNIINVITRLRRICTKTRYRYQEVLNETHPLLTRCQKNGCVGFIQSKDLEITLKDCEELVLEESTNLWKWPTDESGSKQCFWLVTWPISLLLYLTVPDCRKYPRLTSLTFIMCIFWIAFTSYMVAWFITVIGDTLDIPDSVMGLTFLAGLEFLTFVLTFIYILSVNFVISCVFLNFI